MDLIILAAGRNERLRGTVPAFMKPLLLVDGQPLITRIVNDTLTSNALDGYGGQGDVIVVASPQNVGALAEVLPHGLPLFIVQPEPTGVNHAARLGLRISRSSHAALICADNLIEPTAWQQHPFRVGDTKEDILYVHGRDLPQVQAERLTYDVGGCWYEKDLTGIGALSSAFCWLGPLVFNVSNMQAAIDALLTRQDTPSLGLAFNYYPSAVRHVTSMSRDLGVKEELI